VSAQPAAPEAAAPDAAAVAAPIIRMAKDVMCIELKPEVLANYVDCAAPAPATQTTDAPCAEILPEFVDTYQECRIVAMGAPDMPKVEPVLDDVSITSNSRDPEAVGNASTTTSIENGVRSVSITINGETHTLSSNAPITPMPKWNATK